MNFELEHEGATTTVDVPIGRLLIAGFTARDRAAVLAHVEEVKHLGVQLPDRIPALYPSIASRLTQLPAIQVPTPATSGEAEVVFVRWGDRVLVVLGSDHTERSSEGVALVPSKSVCDKPVSRGAWDLADVEAHLEQLILSCEILVDGLWMTYQSGAVGEFMPLHELVQETTIRAGWGPGDVLMCGTLPTAGGGLEYAAAYRMSLRDPVLGRELSLEYAVEVIAVDTDALPDEAGALVGQA